MPPAQLARKEWETQRSKSIAADVVVSLAFAAEGITAGALGKYPLMGALGALSIYMQLHAYYLADIVKPPDFSQVQSVEQPQ